MFAIARSHARSARCYHVAPPRSVCCYVVVSKCFLLMRFIGLLRCSNQDFMYVKKNEFWHPLSHVCDVSLTSVGLGFLVKTHAC